MRKKLYLSVALGILSGCNSLPPKYEAFQDTQTGYYGVKKNGAVIIPAKYKYIFQEQILEGKPLFTASSEHPITSKFFITVMKNGRWQQINKKDEVVFYPFFYDNGPDYFVQGLSRFVTSNFVKNKWHYKIGFYNLEGEIIIEAKYDFANAFQDPLDSCNYNTILDYQYTTVCNGCYFRVDPRNKKYAAMENVYIPLVFYDILEGGKWGVINKKGQIIIPIEYSSDGKAINALKKWKRLPSKY